VIRVLIVAAGARARRALESQLQTQGFEVAGSFASVEGAEEFAGRVPDVILIDGGDAPFEVILDSLEENGMTNEAPVVLLVAAASEDAIGQALRLGVRGILPAEVDPSRLAAALEAVAQGLMVLDPREAGALPQPRATRVIPAGELREALTPREMDVLRLMSAGLANKNIAARLEISEHTAKFHVASILAKLGAGSRTEAVSLGIRRGLLLL
jgi:DNA-binding NarL/FixJ family response regulator